LSIPISNKILVVAESIDVEDSSGTKGRVALIKNLQRAGFQVEVYHYTRKEIELEGIKCVAIKENRSSLFFILSRLERQLRYKTKLKLNKPLEKTFGFSFTHLNDRNSISSYLKGNINFVPDLVITLSKGGSFRPHHALLQVPELHQKWLAYMHDPYPMHLYPRPFNWVEPGYYKKWKFIKEISEKAKFSAFPSLLLKEWMGSYFPNFLKTGVILPHQILDLPIKEQITYPDFFDPDNFNLLHAGTLLSQRNPEALVKGYELFLEMEPGAKEKSRMIFLGGDNIFLTWLNLKSKEIPGLVICDEYMPFELVFNMQQKTSVNIILEAKSEISPFLPGKFPHCVQADKPILILGPYYSEVRRLLGKDYPYWCENDDSKQTAKHIQALYQLWLQDNDLRLNRPDVKEYLSKDNLKKTINQILNR
jgi:hypothetical protein